MRKLLLGIAICLLATGAGAQTRPSTVAMSCAQARNVVASSGAIVLGTGGYTYDRFVADRRFCLITRGDGARLGADRRFASMLHRLPLQGGGHLLRPVRRVRHVGGTTRAVKTSEAGSATAPP